MEIEDNLVPPDFPAQTNVTNAVVANASPNNPPWGVLEALGAWFASVLFILVVPAIFVLPYLASLKIADPEQLMEFAKTDPTSVFLQIAAVIPAHLLTILLAWVVVTRVRKYPFREMLGWTSGGIRWWHYIVILVLFFAIAAVVGTFAKEQENDLIRMLQSSRSALYIMAFLATFTAPLVEEVIYRGILYSAFQRRLGVGAAFFLVTFLFAVVHVPQYYPSYPTIFLLTILSLTLTAVRVRSNNLLPCVILHTLFNGIQSLGLILGPEIIKPADIPEQVSAIFHLLK